MTDGETMALTSGLQSSSLKDVESVSMEYDVESCIVDGMRSPEPSPEPSSPPERPLDQPKKRRKNGRGNKSLQGRSYLILRDEATPHPKGFDANQLFR